MKYNYKCPVFPDGNFRFLLNLYLDPSELKERIPLIFKNGVDDLDWFIVANYFDKELGELLILKYEHAPNNLTCILVANDLNVRVALDRIKTILTLEKKEIFWNSEYAQYLGVSEP